MTDKIETTRLVPLGLTRSTTLRHAFLLLLRELNGTRLLPIVLDEGEYNRLEAAISKNDTSETYLARRFCTNFNIKLDAVMLTRTKDNGYRAFCIARQDDGRTKFFELDAVTGIIAATGLKAPLQIATQTFEAMYDKKGEEGLVAIPVTAMNDALLAEALEMAVAEENYELASQLNEELRKRRE